MIDTNVSTFEDYQRESRKTAKYPDIGNNMFYVTLGLAGETGEVCEKIKKLIRDKEGKIDQEFLEGISKEIGDALWYMSNLCSELGFSFECVARKNLEKLKDRLERNKISGEGDDR